MRRLPAYLLMLALAVAGLIPAGWMPASGGKTLLVICTGDGVQQQWVDLGGRDQQAPGHATSHGCPYSGLATAAVLPLPDAPRPAQLAQAARWSRLPFTHHSAGFHWRYDARGPPAFS